MTNTQNTTVIQLAPDGKHLITQDGQAVYRFVPMKHDPQHETIPWGDEWPEYLRPWVLTWVPLGGKPKAGPGIRQGDLHTYSRAGSKRFDYPQIGYRGWWLYAWKHEGPGETHSVAGLWERVAVDVPYLGGTPTEPPTYNGGP